MSVLDFFRAEKTNYSHRHRTIEIIAEEQNIDIKNLEEEIKSMLERKGRSETIIKLTHRFHVPLSVAWNFVDKLDPDPLAEHEHKS